MDIVVGSFLGVTGTLRICNGFIPDEVSVLSVTSGIEAFWDKTMRLHAGGEGVHVVAAGDRTRLAHGEGIAPYIGGDLFSTAQTLYLVKDPAPNKVSANVASGYAKLTQWTNGSVANRTGSFNDRMNTTYVGIGSEIIVKEDVTGITKTAFIVLYSNYGAAANEVELSTNILGGQILYVGPMYDFTGIAANKITPPGFVIVDANPHYTGDYCRFKAIKW